MNFLSILRLDITHFEMNENKAIHLKGGKVHYVPRWHIYVD